jgi:hypothetical protein
MTGWTADELEKIETADELEIASFRSDGTLGSNRTIWVVRVDDDLYVRSVNGRTSDWFRGTQRHHKAGSERAASRRTSPSSRPTPTSRLESTTRTGTSTDGTPRASSTARSPPRRDRRR